MKKPILNIPSSLLFVLLILLIFLPYFTFDFFRQKQIIQDKENHQKLLLEESARKEAQKKAEDAKIKIYLTGKFDPGEREDFVPVPAQYALTGNKIYLRKETYEAYLRMASAAGKDEIDLKIASATRNFDYQKNLWNDKWTGAQIVEGQNLARNLPDGLQRFKKILQYSAVPGTSRHHWGTDIDINNVNPSYFNGYKGAKEYEWLTKNAPLFGFCQTYNKKGPERPGGYNEEKWHWSYLPLARVFTAEYKDLIKNDDIKGFDGDEFVPQLDLINNYVLGINPDCI